MSPPLEEQLGRWRQAGLLDAETAERIRAFEAAQPAARARWPIRVALGAGGLMVAASVLLFVAANWEGLAPAGRSAVLVAALMTFHLAGAALAERFPASGTTLHALGTATLGAVVFLLGQTFNLQAEWPRGFLLWAMGAWAGWLLLRSWPQVFLAAVLTPSWLVAEWLARYDDRGALVPVSGLALLAFVYLAAERAAERDAPRRTLAIIGAVACLPLAAALLVIADESSPTPAPPLATSLGWLVAIGGPLLLAWLLRRREAWHAAVAAAWIAATGAIEPLPDVFRYVWAAIGALLVIASGVADGAGRRISVGFGGFALTVVVFYFANVLDRIGRATGLLVGGLLFLGAGFFLERLRRQLLARATREGA